MEATLTLHQAGTRLGVEDTVLSRLIRIGALPEARKVHRPDGDVWVIPTDSLEAVATRNGWTIDLRGASPTLSGDATGSGQTDGSGPGSDNDPSLATGGESAVAPAMPTAPTGHRRHQGSDASSDQDADTPSDSDAAAPSAQDAMSQSTQDAMSQSTQDAMSQSAQDANAAHSTDMASDRGDESSALVPHQDASPAINDDPTPSLAEVIDLALLDRLLDVQEERVTAKVEARETKHALAALNETHNRTTGELEIERRERMITADRYREERMARAVADAKVAELRDRVVREMTLAEEQKRAHTDALTRSIQAERDAANALSVMSWRARRRYRKLSTEDR